MFGEEVYGGLPDLLKQLVEPFEGREKDIVLLSAITTLGVCMPKIKGMYRGSEVYPNLYLFVVAPPASGKGVVSYPRGLADYINDMLFENRRQEVLACRKENKEKKSNKVCPKNQVKIIPGNISSAQLYSLIEHSHEGALIIESEADTLTAALKQEWGNFSDSLRAAYHHENISISRKEDDVYVNIPKPRISLVLGGTSNQVKPLVQSVENGLFSRFLFYCFDETQPWKDVSAVEINYSEHFKSVGKEILLDFYNNLNAREGEVNFILTAEQLVRLNQTMSHIYELVVKGYPPEFTSNVKRHALMAFRLCMILSAIRQREVILEANTITCDDLDFEIAMNIVRTVLHHAAYVLSKESGSIKLSELEQTVLSAMGPFFTRAEILKEARKQGMSPRTLDDKLRQWIFKGIVKKLSHGNYRNHRAIVD